MAPAPSINAAAASAPGSSAAAAPDSPGKPALGKRKRGKSDGKQQHGGQDGRRASQRVKREQDGNGNGLGDGNGVGWNEELEQQLVPKAEECWKLARVLKMLDKHGVATEALPDEAGVPTLLEALDPTSQGFPHSLSTLEFYLDLALASVKARLRAREAKGKAVAAPRTSNTDVYEAQHEVGKFSETIKRLIDESKDAAAIRMGMTRHKPATPKYALHRSLGNLDVFTSAADLSVDDKALTSLRDTDVVAVHQALPSQKPSIPTLGDISARTSTSERSQLDLGPRIKPVTFLYYDPYQSFAPTHDSSTASLSYAQSAHFRAARQSLSNWQKRPLPPLPPSPSSSKAVIRPPIEDIVLSLIDPQLASASASTSSLPDAPAEVTDEDVRNYLRQMEDSEIVEDRLKENTELLRVLQEAQFARLRREAGGPGPTSSPSSREAFKAESETAQRLLESLTTIMNARPRTLNSASMSEALPSTSDPSVYKRLKRELVQPDSAIYHGVLDKQNAKGIRDFVMTSNAFEVAGRQQQQHQESSGNGAGGAGDRKPFLGSLGSTSASTPSNGKKGTGAGSVKKEKKAKSVTPGVPQASTAPNRMNGSSSLDRQAEAESARFRRDNGPTGMAV